MQPSVPARHIILQFTSALILGTYIHNTIIALPLPILAIRRTGYRENVINCSKAILIIILSK